MASNAPGSVEGKTDGDRAEPATHGDDGVDLDTVPGPLKRPAGFLRRHRGNFYLMIVMLLVGFVANGLTWAAGDRDTVGRFTKGMWLEFDPTRAGATMKVDRGDVPVHRIDERVKVGSLAVVKVDVEGMEPHVLRGMRGLLRKHLPVVYCETHTDEKEAEIASVLEPLGYTLTEKLKQGSPMHRWNP